MLHFGIRRIWSAILANNLACMRREHKPGKRTGSKIPFHGQNIYDWMSMVVHASGIKQFYKWVILFFVSNYQSHDKFHFNSSKTGSTASSSNWFHGTQIVIHTASFLTIILWYDVSRFPHDSSKNFNLYSRFILLMVRYHRLVTVQFLDWTP